ncbi:MAG: hypothetical protein AAGA65_25360 [Actinomycetota bacterium]
MTWLPVGGVDLAEDTCDEESDIGVHISDDLTYPLTAGYFLVDPVNAQIVGHFILNGAYGFDPDTRLFSPTGRWLLYNCGIDFYLFAEGGPPVTFDDLILDVISQLDPPDPPLQPTPDHGRHVVQMPSWLAIDSDYWYETRTARADTAPLGRFFVEASLTPTHIEWDLGNGEPPLTCANPGTVWQSGLPESANDCEYTYAQPSINPPDNEWELTATIHFEVTDVQTNPELDPADFGPWPLITRTSTETIQVVEIQAVAQPNP